MSHTHPHDHHGEHHEHLNPDFKGVQGNKDYFNKHAEQYEEMPWAKVLVGSVAEVMKEVHTFDPESTVMMDFACGTGMFYSFVVQHLTLTMIT